MNPQALKAKIFDVAKELSIPFNEAFHRLVMERFLMRLNCSAHREKFIFKGGFLLSHYLNLGRYTQDLDFLIQGLKGEKLVLERALQEIGAQNVGDGLTYLLNKVVDLPHEHMKYGGFRAQFQITIGAMREFLEIDVGIGDVVEPLVESLTLLATKQKPVYEREVSLHVYPPEFILAEKLQTIVSRGASNSRMKDFYDCLNILKKLDLPTEKMRSAIQKTFTHRDTQLQLLPIQLSDETIIKLSPYWNAFVRRLPVKEGVPETLRMAVDLINKELIVRLVALDA